MQSKSWKFLLALLSVVALPLSYQQLLNPAHAQASASDDVVLKAMNDEMVRTKTRLRLATSPLPYFSSYSVKDNQTLNIYCSFGALDLMHNSHSRSANADVRIGDFKLDSGGPTGLFRMDSPHSNIIIDND